MKRILLCAVLLASVARGEDLTVLDEKIAGGPPKQTLSRYLRQLADRAFERRRAEYEKLKTEEQILAYQKRMRKEFITRLGGFPKRTPLNAKVVGALERDRFRIEKILFESQPQHYVTATLYLPKQGKPPYPGVVIPSGHSATGKGASYNQQGCMILASNGIAAMAYDPIGQGARSQFLDEKAKPRFRSTTEHTITGVGSIPLGLNTATYRIWDGMRAIDYLCSRKEIDAKKIGVTGCSGGGTLSSYLMALDERVVCAAPSCYLTSFKRLIETIGPQDAEQNIFGQIQIGLDHADYIMMRAPKPTLILAATRDFFDIQGTWDSFRQAKRLYTRLDHPERVSLVETPTKHGYPTAQREPMAQWMRRWLLKIDKPVTELDQETTPVEKLFASPKGQTMLIPGARSVVDLNRAINAKLKARRTKLWKDPQQALKEVRRITGIGEMKSLPRPTVRKSGVVQRDGYEMQKLVLSARTSRPAWLCIPQKSSGKKVLYLHGQGKHVDAEKGGPIEKLVLQGKTVLAVDLSGIGETGSGTDGIWGGNWKDVFLAYLLGKSLVGIRTEDALIASRFLSEHGKGEPDLELIAIGSTGPAALHAAALESSGFSSVKLTKSLNDWSDLVDDPTRKGRLVHVFHGALRAYDLSDLRRHIERQMKME